MTNYKILLVTYFILVNSLASYAQTENMEIIEPFYTCV